MTRKAFSTWTHPATGETRIYCNTSPRGVKVWAEKTDASYIIKGRYDYQIPAEYRSAGKTWAISLWFDALKAAGFTTDDAFGGTFEDFATFAA
ncbi:MAG: hypothetical protein KBG46_14380 [Paracoccus sp.]|jgi:hypothetical protein|nr:hypothetical protein [Paracoccus sp. (in: a-proteobacteria)]